MEKKEYTPSQPLRLIYDRRYDYVGLWRYPAYCWLRVYAPHGNTSDIPVVIMIQLPDNPGTSITNFSEKLAWKIVHDPAVWQEAQEAPREGCLWAEHYYPEDQVDLEKPFALVTYTYSEAAEEDAARAGTMTFVYEDPDDPEHFEMDEPVCMPVAGEQGTLGQPSWRRVTREVVERMIGQPFAPLPPVQVG